MGNFSNNAITDVGKMLLADVHAGAVFTPTRIVIGSGSMVSGATAKDMTDVITPIISLAINKKKRSPDGKCVFGGVYTNAEVTQPFYFRELALYAKAVYHNADGSVKSEGEEILYSYGNAGANADYMPAHSTAAAIEKQIDLVTWVGNDAQVDLTIETGIYLTQVQGVQNAQYINPDTTGYASLLEYMASIYEKNLIVSGHISGFSDMPDGVTALHGTINVVGGLMTIYGNARTAYYYRGTNSLTAWTSEWRKVFDTGNAPTPAEVGAVAITGDTMTGDLLIDKPIAAVRLKTAKGTANFFKNANTANDLGTDISDENAAGVTDRINLSAERSLAEKLRLVVAGEKIYNILHTGNKELINPADIGAVSKAGDTMTNDLTIQKAVAPSLRLNEGSNGAGSVVQQWGNQLLLAIQNKSNDNANSRILILNNSTHSQDIAQALRISDKVNNVETYYTILHSGNLHVFGLGAVPATVE